MISASLCWGGLSHDPHELEYVWQRDLLPHVLAEPGKIIAHGAGRSYGDVALNPGGRLLMTERLDQFISFDAISGILECESGVLLGTIQRLMIERGWMLSVSPGTQWVTVGGAIANDVHGKNHDDAGSFGHHVLSLRLVRTDGQLLNLVDPDAPLFRATLGGLGLTGMIQSARLKLMRVPGAWMEQEIQPFHHVDDYFQLAHQHDPQWPYTVAWLDCTRYPPRGLFMRGKHSPLADQIPKEKHRRMPWSPPFSLVNRLSLHLFNPLYYHTNRLKASPRLVHYQPFLYPLDHIQNWNRMYGRKGFYQYQCLVPPHSEREAVKALLQTIVRSGRGSFLAVLKTFGQRTSPGMLSFARPGTTLALDFPNESMQTERLFQRLDRIIQEAGGCIYMAKDARMPVALFRTGYPDWERFLDYRDPGLSSALSRRLLGC